MFLLTTKSPMDTMEKVTKRKHFFNPDIFVIVCQVNISRGRQCLHQRVIKCKNRPMPISLQMARNLDLYL